MAARKFSAVQVNNEGYEEYLSEGSSHYYSESVSENAEEGDGGYADFILDQPGLTEADGGEDWAPSGSQYNYYGSGSGTQSQSTGTETCPDCETFKVVQLNSDPADPSNCGVIGYVYTYSIRKRHRTIKRAQCPKCSTKIVYVKDPPDKSADVERRIKAAEENITFAQRQVERFKHDIKIAKQRKKEAEEERFRLEGERLGEGSKKNKWGRQTQSSQSSSIPQSSFSPASSAKSASYEPTSGSSATDNKPAARKKQVSVSASYSGGGSSYNGSSSTYRTPSKGKTKKNKGKDKAAEPSYSSSASYNSYTN